MAEVVDTVMVVVADWKDIDIMKIILLTVFLTISVKSNWSYFEMHPGHGVLHPSEGGPDDPLVSIPDNSPVFVVTAAKDVGGGAGGGVHLVLEPE